MESKERLKQRGKATLAVPLADADTKKASAAPPRRRNTGSSGGISLGMVVVLVVVSVVAAVVGTYAYFTQVFLVEHDVQLLIPLQKVQDQKIQEEENKYRTLQSQVVSLNEEKAKLDQKVEKIPQMEHRIDVLVKKRHKSNLAIKEMSKRRLLEKFGPGPHYVEMKLQFDPDSNIAKDGDNTAKIILELASEEDMPHTVHWFLEQVDRHMYDGTSFHRNAGHVIQAGPAPNFLSDPEPHLMKPFRDSGMASVLFQEYSEEHPHVKYTMGYAGRPGGPDFYISMQDNTRNHGPGGQGSYEDASEADPCFAKVVQGFEVADRIHQSDVKPGDYKHMEHNVAITSMRQVHYHPDTNKIDEEDNDDKAAADMY